MVCHRDVWRIGFTAGKPNVLHIWMWNSIRSSTVLNHIHSMKYAEVINASCAANLAETDYSTCILQNFVKIIFLNRNDKKSKHK